MKFLLKIMISLLVMSLLVASCGRARQKVLPDRKSSESFSFAQMINSAPLPPDFIEKKADRIGNIPLPDKFILIGWDSAAWNVINPLLRQGKLPNLAKLLERSAYGVLQTDVALSPISWTTIVTGMDRANHGIQNNPEDEESVWREALGDSRGVLKAQLWDMIPKTRFKNRGILSFYFPPPIDDFNGTIYCDYAVTIPGLPCNCEDVDQEELSPCLINCAGDHVDFDELYVIFRLIDVAGHKYITSFLTTEYGRDHVLKYAPGIEQKMAAASMLYVEEYEKADTFLKKYVDDENALIVIVSDHGMEPTLGTRESQILPDSFFKSLKVRQAFPTSQKPVEIEVNQWDESARLLFTPFTHTTDVVSDQSGAYVLENEITLYGISCKGRDEPECPTTIKKFLESHLKDLKYERVRFYKETVTKQGEVIFTPTQKGLEKASSAPPGGFGDFFKTFSYQGVHLSDDPGILILAGPGVKAGKLFSEAHLKDVTPTALALLGLPVAADFDGQVLTEAVNPAFLSAHPLKTIPSYGAGHKIASQQSVLTAKQKEKLKQLGYLK